MTAVPRTAGLLTWACHRTGGPDNNASEMRPLRILAMTTEEARGAQIGESQTSDAGVLGWAGQVEDGKTCLEFRHSNRGVDKAARPTYVMPAQRMQRDKEARPNNATHAWRGKHKGLHCVLCISRIQRLGALQGENLCLLLGLRRLTLSLVIYFWLATNLAYRGRSASLVSGRSLGLDRGTTTLDNHVY